MMGFLVNPEGHRKKGSQRQQHSPERPHEGPCASEPAKRKGSWDLRPHQSPVPHPGVHGEQVGQHPAKRDGVGPEGLVWCQVLKILFSALG